MKCPAPPRIITIVVRDGSDIDVHEGEGYANRLTWDEMLATVVDLTHPTLARRGEARYFQTPAQREASDARRAARYAERDARKAQVAAERAALPLQLRALHLYVEMEGRRASSLDDDLLPIEQQPEDVQQAMRLLAAGGD